MPQPIPSLSDCAGGRATWRFRSLGERTGVWAEPSVLEAAAYEFADVEAMVAVVREAISVPIAGAATTSWCCRPASRSAGWRTRG